MTFALPIAPMVSVSQLLTSTGDLSYSDLAPKLLKVDFSTRHLMHSPNPSIFIANNSLAGISNIVHCLPTTVPVRGPSINDLFPLLSPSYHAIHLDRVAAVNRHDADAWAQERKSYNTKPDAVAASFSLGSKGSASDDCLPIDMAWSTSALMEPCTQKLWAMEQFSDPAQLREDATACSHNWTSPTASGLSVLLARTDVVISPGSREGLSEGRRRVGEILVRCGVIDISESTPVESTTAGCNDVSDVIPIRASRMSPLVTERLFCVDDRLLITVLADWTSEWLHTLVVRPYLRGSFRFQYYGQSSRVTTSVASRIHRVFRGMNNPMQVVIHVLWIISVLTGNGMHANAPFLSVPIFRYLHNNGTFVAEDFMFHTFVACAMISDKTINDATLSANTWNHLTRIPQVILNATERYALGCLKWKVVMTQTQWQDIIFYLRSCIKMGSGFNPFAYEGTSSYSIIACYLDELISASYVDDPYTTQRQALTVEILAPQSTQQSMCCKTFDAAEWCPEDDPVINRKPRAIGIAPGADRNSDTFKVGTTAKDLLDSILGSSSVPDLSHLGRPTGISFCGSFGAIRAQLAHTVKIASACQKNASQWTHSHNYLTTRP